jgi:hypothetical protein
MNDVHAVHEEEAQGLRLLGRLWAYKNWREK